MSELQNPIFDEEKEFLERKKLEYERALRGDVEHLKDQTQKVGKLALVGAGLAGSVWLITKAFSSKKRKRRQPAGTDADGFEAGYYGGSAGGRHAGPKLAAASAEVFLHEHEQEYGADGLGFGTADHYADSAAADEPAMASYHQPDVFDEDDEEDDDKLFDDDPFQDLPYDDSRRLPTSHAFDGSSDGGAAARRRDSRSRMVGSVLQAFLQSDTGKVLVGQVAAVALALVTKKIGELFPTPKNSDLAATPGQAVATSGASPIASSAPSAFPDASTHSQSL